MTTYKEVNAAWPDPMPVPSPREALHGARSLIRRAFALAKEDGAGQGFTGCGPYMKRMKFKVTSGRRYTYPRSGVWHVNPNGKHFGGWRDIVHGISHWAGRRFWPNEDPHSPRHVWIEQQLALHAIECMPRWAVALSASEMRKKPKPDVKTVRATRVASAIRRWQTKRKRADTALRKLRRQARYYGLEANV